MDHLHRDVDPGLAGQKDNAAPVGGQHGRQVVAGEAHAAHEIDFDDGLPVGVTDCFEGPVLVHPQVVDQDVYYRKGPDGLLGALGLSQVGRQGFEFCLRLGLANFLHGLVHPALAEPVDDHPAPLRRQRLGNGQPDTGSGPGHQGQFVFQFEVYKFLGFFFLSSHRCCHSQLVRIN